MCGTARVVRDCSGSEEEEEQEEQEGQEEEEEEEAELQRRFRRKIFLPAGSVPAPRSPLATTQLLPELGISRF